MRKILLDFLVILVCFAIVFGVSVCVSGIAKRSKPTPVIGIDGPSEAFQLIVNICDTIQVDFPGTVCRIRQDDWNAFSIRVLDATPSMIIHKIILEYADKVCEIGDISNALRMKFSLNGITICDWNEGLLI